MFCSEPVSRLSTQITRWPVGEQVIAQVRAEEAGAAGDDAGGHRRREDSGAGGARRRRGPGLIAGVDAVQPPTRSRARRGRAARARTAPLCAGSPAAISLCADDADDALQRALEILLTKAPPLEPGAPARLDDGRHQARGARRPPRARAPARRRRPPTRRSTRSPRDAPGPPSAPSAASASPRRARALAALKADERLAIVLQAEGYSYAEICELCGWTYTKVNRCLAEGRARLRAAARGCGLLTSAGGGGGGSSSA